MVKKSTWMWIQQNTCLRMLVNLPQSLRIAMTQQRMSPTCPTTTWFHLKRIFWTEAVKRTSRRRSRGTSFSVSFTAPRVFAFAVHTVQERKRAIANIHVLKLASSLGSSLWLLEAAWNVVLFWQAKGFPFCQKRRQQGYPWLIRHKETSWGIISSSGKLDKTLWFVVMRKSWAPVLAEVQWNLEQPSPILSKALSDAWGYF